MLTGEGVLRVAFGTAGDRDDEVLRGWDSPRWTWPTRHTLGQTRVPAGPDGEEMRAQFTAGMLVAGAASTQCFDGEQLAWSAFWIEATRVTWIVITVAEQLQELEDLIVSRGGAEVDADRWSGLRSRPCAYPCERSMCACARSVGQRLRNGVTPSPPARRRGWPLTRHTRWPRPRRG